MADGQWLTLLRQMRRALAIIGMLEGHGDPFTLDTTRRRIYTSLTHQPLEELILVTDFIPCITRPRYIFLENFSLLVAFHS